MDVQDKTKTVDAGKVDAKLNPGQNPGQIVPGKTATLTFGDKQVPMPVRSGSIGPDVIDIAKVYAQSGAFTYDPGFTSTANCSSKITYIDGDKGVLLYRGYPIEQLAEKRITLLRKGF